MFRQIRFALRMCVLNVPLLSSAQLLRPPPQEYVLHFQPNAVAFTDQIHLGAAFTMESWVFLDTTSQEGGGVIMGKTNYPRGAAPFFRYMLGIDGRKPWFTQSAGQPLPSMRSR